MKSFYLIAFTLGLGSAWSQGTGTFPPAAQQNGSTAIHKDSSIVKAWIQLCALHRGYLDIADKSLGLASHGDSSAAFGKANDDVVSLGDSGYVEVSFNPPLSSQSGPEIAIFENSFSDNFLELAFVEISSDGQNFVRFPAVSLTQDTNQIDAFGPLYPSDLHNLAGKYRSGYGVPFDFDELKDSLSLNLMAISHLRIVDVIGSINSNLCNYDSQNHKINDPYPTNFASGGFDLDAVAILHPSSGIGIIDFPNAANMFYPNPAKEKVFFSQPVSHFEILSLNGEVLIKNTKKNSSEVKINHLTPGVYILCLNTNGNLFVDKLIVP